jgi:hypothetical protein
MNIKLLPDHSEKVVRYLSEKNINFEVKDNTICINASQPEDYLFLGFFIQKLRTNANTNASGN